MKFQLIICAIISVGLLSCESLVNDIPASKLPQAESKLVVQSFISPQAENISVAVSESEPLFGSSTGFNNWIKDAIVKISDGTKEVEIPFDLYGNIYSIEATKFPIVAGKTYYLSVSSGTKKVMAECTVPIKTVKIKSFTLDTTLTNNGVIDLTKLATLRMDWPDIPGEANFYRVHAAIMLEYGVIAEDDPKHEKETRVTSGFNFLWDESAGRSEIQSDKNLDGSIFSSPLGRINAQTVIQANKFIFNNQKVKSLVMEVFNTDINYYRYHRDLEMRGDDDNPFTEPSMIHSNIVGGLGCFGAYNVGRRVELY